jgi:hypothetical protein
MNAYSKNNERKEKISPIIIVREYKNKKSIDNRGYSDKIKAIFNGMDKEITNIRLRKIPGLFSGIIQERFKKLDLKCKKLELSSLISSKLRNFSGTNLKAEREKDSFSKLIMDKFKNEH